jgi:hypothetical protein
VSTAQQDLTRQVRGKGQCLCVRQSDLYYPAPGNPSGTLDLRFRRIDGGHRRWRALVEDQLRENPGAAANIEPSRGGGRSYPIQETLAESTAPAPMNCS